MRPATEKQLEYIERMTKGRFSNEADLETVSRHLKQAGRSRISELSIEEASDLIKELLERDVTYRFLCGEQAQMSRKEAHRLNLIGELEACLHACPRGVDPNNCDDFREQYD